MNSRTLEDYKCSVPFPSPGIKNTYLGGNEKEDIIYVYIFLLLNNLNEGKSGLIID